MSAAEAAAAAPTSKKKGVTWRNNKQKSLENSHYFYKNAPVSEEAAAEQAAAAAAVAQAAAEEAAAAEAAKYMNQPAHPPLNAPPAIQNKYVANFLVRDLFTNYDILPRSVKEDLLTANEEDVLDEYKGLLIAIREIRNMPPTTPGQNILLTIYKYFGDSRILKQNPATNIGALLQLSTTYKKEKQRLLGLQEILLNKRKSNNTVLQEAIDYFHKNNAYTGGRRRNRSNRHKRTNRRRVARANRKARTRKN